MPNIRTTHVYSGSEKKLHSILAVSKVELSSQLYAPIIKLSGRNRVLNRRPGSSMDPGRESNAVDVTGNSILRSWSCYKLWCVMVIDTVALRRRMLARLHNFQKGR